MGLRGQANGGGERGYAMAALLVTLAIMSILMSVAMPVWRQEARREKEAELIFRGEQYARAIALFRTKNNNALPASIDVLVTGRYLRKKFREPMAKDGEWRLIPAGSGQPVPGQPQPGVPPQQQPQQPGQSQIAGGIMGVSSKSTENSLRLYQGANRYDQWIFRYTDVARGRGGIPTPDDPTGRGIPGRGNPGRGNPGRGNPNQPGRGGFPTLANPGSRGAGPQFPPAGGRGVGPGSGTDRPFPPPGGGRSGGRGQ